MTRRGGVSEPAADAAIGPACRTVQLPTIRDRAGELADAAACEQMTFRAFLAEVLIAECDDRDGRRRYRRVREAAFPRPKRLEAFDYTANPDVNPGLIASLATAGLGDRRRTALPDR